MTKVQILAELAIIRARMQAVLLLLPAAACPIEATDALYGRQEALRELLHGMEGYRGRAPDGSEAKRFSGRGA